LALPALRKLFFGLRGRGKGAALELKILFFQGFLDDVLRKVVAERNAPQKVEP